MTTQIEKMSANGPLNLRQGVYQHWHESSAAYVGDSETVSPNELSLLENFAQVSLFLLNFGLPITSHYFQVRGVTGC